MSAYGIMAEFSDPRRFAAAVAQARESGYTQVETYMPYGVEGVAELPPGQRSPVPLAMLIGGLLSGLGAFFLQLYAAYDYPVNVGGRPLNSWPAFIPITFELTVLGSAITGLATFFIVVGFPRLEHPVFNHPRFDRASQDRFFLLVRSADPRLAGASLERLRREWDADSVEEVPS